jgi:hypothetical protein
MDATAEDGPSMSAALAFAAREAVRRQVDLRLVYGTEALPPWALTVQLIGKVIEHTSAVHPELAITTAFHPGTSARALAIASASASLVVVAAGPELDDGEVITGLATATTITRAPVIVVVAAGPIAVPRPAALVVRYPEPALAG